ncbi:uncharacterized protein N7496_007158 [Penicillium cataractarum]|uniref:Uncharacterized protein n=1 Tax=Penicillium cataractarum TaxID=2100454 RepID=A0A9W9V9B7_9EURO|nr:uncharacterized protein N7496_007158 [Penicillium cataractarum]KAJ5371066.1 hypothetical protein N7496_007158 [Penicillium cataractarum]
MFSRLFSYLCSGHSAKKGEQLADWNVELLATANSKLALQLQRADKKIKNLKTRLAESDLLLAHAQSHVGDFNYAALRLEDDLSEMPAALLNSEADRRFNWIDDIWICTGNDYLKDAEEVWKIGDIEAARSTLETSLMASSCISVAEILHSRVFHAAILYATGKYHESLCQLDRVMNYVSTRSEVQQLRYKDIVGTAFFIEAMDFMATERFERAYWSFSRSLPHPQYCHKAREYQIKAIVEFTRQQACEDGASDSLSLRPMISLGEHLPVPADVDDDPCQYRVW